MTAISTPPFCTTAANQEDKKKAEAASLEFLRICAELGGTISGEHGIGVEKLEAMHFVFGDNDLRAQRFVKEAFDPRGLCNPGKVLPGEAEGTPMPSRSRPSPPPWPSGWAACRAGPGAARDRDRHPRREALCRCDRPTPATGRGAGSGRLRTARRVHRRRRDQAGLGQPARPLRPSRQHSATCARTCDVDADDLTMTVAAGVTVAEARAQARAQDRVLPLDGGRPGRATVGGVTATGDQGARGAAYGAGEGPGARPQGHARRRHAGGFRRAHHEERGRLRHDEAVRRLVRGARSDHRGHLPPSSPTRQPRRCWSSRWRRSLRGRRSAAQIMDSCLQPLVLEVLSPASGRFAGRRSPSSAAAGAGGGPLLLAGFAGHPAAVARSVAEVSRVVRRPDGDESSETPRPRRCSKRLTGSAAADARRPEAGTGAGRDAPLTARATVPISEVWGLAQTAESLAAAAGPAARLPDRRRPRDPRPVGGPRSPPASRTRSRSRPGSTGLRAAAVARGGQLTVTDGLDAAVARLRRLGRPGPGGPAHEAASRSGSIPTARSIPAGSWGASDGRPQSGRRRDAAAAGAGGVPGPLRPRHDLQQVRVLPTRLPDVPSHRAGGARGPGQGGPLPQHHRGPSGDRAPPSRTPSPTACSAGRAPTAASPAIKTDDVVISFRHAYAERFGRGFLQRRVFRTLLPRPRLMRGLVRFVWAFRKTGLVDAARRIGLVGLLNPKLERALELGAGEAGAAAQVSSRQSAAAAKPRLRRPAQGRLLDVLRLQLRASRGG